PRAEAAAGDRLQVIPGELPDPTTVPAGCPYAPRCPFVMDICREVNPRQFEIDPEWTAACHLWSPRTRKALVR
ncbi:MAG: oligopeptide/dipeptide ABC transporter ATP-binding protein, partial [Solirubrobacterales bacterium]